VDLGDFERAAERFASAAKIHRDLGTQAWAAVNYGGLGRALLMRAAPGDLEAALAQFRTAAEISRRVYYPENISQHAGDIGRCLFLLGHEKEAREAVREAVSLERVIGANKDLRHFGNLVTLARIAKALGRTEECREAVFRARDLQARLKLGKTHRVKRVREDLEALAGIVDSLDSDDTGSHVSSLLNRHGGRPLDSAELNEISALVASSFDRLSYEYPWTGLENDLRTQNRSTIRLFGYGSLVNQESALRTFAGGGERLTAAIAFGVIRLFNFEMPDVVRARYGGISDDDPYRGLLNAQVTGFMTDVANGVVIDMSIDEIQGLRDREVGYDLRPIVCVEWNAAGRREPQPAYILSCPNRLWKGRPLTNAGLSPYPRYLEQCVAGAASVSESFLGFWRDTTFAADGERLIASNGA
jgi:hypothetical protein